MFLPRESHKRRSLVGYSPWGRKESDRTEQLIHTHTHTQDFLIKNLLYRKGYSTLNTVSLKANSSNITTLLKRLKKLRPGKTKFRQEWVEESGLSTLPTATLASTVLWLGRLLTLASWSTHVFLVYHSLHSCRWGNDLIVFNFGPGSTTCTCLLVDFNFLSVDPGQSNSRPARLLPPHPLPLHTMQIYINFGGPGNCQNTSIDLEGNRL